MPRNGSGVASIPNSFAPSTTISSSAMNANFTDVANMLTASLALDGQSEMTGQLKAADGTVSAPGLAFASDSNTGFRRSASGTIKAVADGVDVATFSSTGIDANLTGSWSAIPAGTVMLFAQTSAPTGWTKSTTHNNKALRVVSGSASSGGSVDFTTAFASQAVSGTVGNTTLTIDQIPAHTHSYTYYRGPTLGETTSSGYLANNVVSGTTGSAGGGQAHTHTFTGTAINLAVAYVDVILATRD